MRHFMQYPLQAYVDNVKSPGEFHDAILSNDVDLDFARIFQFFLDALSDIARELVHREVCDLTGVHEDAYLAPRGYRIDFFYSIKRICEAL